MPIHFSDTGSGPAVMLLHGCPGTTSYFSPLVDALSARFRVLVPDLPGYGASPPVQGEYRLSLVQAMLEDGLLARGVEEVALTGFSMGAYRALGFALDSTRVRVTRVALLGGVAGFDDDVRERYRQLAQMVLAGVDFSSSWLDMMAAPNFAQRFPHCVSELLAWIDAAPRAVLAQELDAFAGSPDLRPRLRELEIPVLARVGELDQTAPVAWSRAITDRVANGELQIAQGSGHALLYENREATVEAVRRFLALGDASTASDRAHLA